MSDDLATSATAKIRILLADDHRLMREGVRRMLAAEATLEVVADTGDGRSAVSLAADLRPDVVLMDMTMPELNGIDATRQIKAENAGVAVIGVSMHADRQFVTELLAAGGSGYLLKDCPLQELIASIHAVAAGEVYLSTKVASIVLKELPGSTGDGPKRYFGALTPREREILQLVADGGSSKSIAARLGLSVKTVDTHRRQVMEKLQLDSVAALTHYAIRQGLTPLQ